MKISATPEISKLTPDAALLDSRLLGAGLGDPVSWSAWLSILKAASGLPLSAEDRALFHEVAGEREPPSEPVRQLWCVAGRRSGKSRIAAALATFEAAFSRHGLAAGETGHVLTLAPSRSQARIIFGYIRGFLEESPVLRQLVKEIKIEEIELTNNVVISVHTANYRTIRGRTLLAVVADEMAFFRDELSANPDVEVFRAVLPALTTTKGRFIAISTAYAQRGLLFEKYKQHFGVDSPDTLVIKAPTRLLNPTIGEDEISSAIAADPEAGRAEWESIFRGDISSYVDRDVLEQCIARGQRENAWIRGHRHCAFVDVSGGQRDSSALGIAHQEGENAVVLDVVREWKSPHSPADAVQEMCGLLKDFRITTVTGDAYGGSWAMDEFRKFGIRYVFADKSKSEIYLTALPLLTSRRAVLLDNQRLVGQVAGLERRTARGGARDTVDHAPRGGAQDDVANAACGALVLAAAGGAARATPQSIRVEGMSGNYDALSW